MTSITDAEGGTVSYSYDALDRLIATVDANGAKTTFAYDNEGNQIGEKDALNYSSSKTYVTELLESYQDRNRLIAILRYELEHPAKIGKSEQIEAINYGHGNNLGHAQGHISNKTFYIALNYEEQADRLNTEASKEIADELFELEQRQKKLLYYIALLEKRQANILRLVYIERVTTKEVAERYGLTYRTIDRIKKEAIDRIAEMYAYSERYNG